MLFPTFKKKLVSKKLFRGGGGGGGGFRNNSFSFHFAFMFYGTNISRRKKHLGIKKKNLEKQLFFI